MSRPFPPPANLRALTSQPERSAFRIAFELALHARRDRMLAGSVSNLYSIAEADGAAWKIGLAQDPHDRLATLQQGNPRPLVLYAWMPAPFALERFIHHVLRRERISGEWFNGPRTLALVAAIESVQEIGFDIAAMEIEPDAVDTMYALTSFADDIVIARRAA